MSGIALGARAIAVKTKQNKIKHAGATPHPAPYMPQSSLCAPGGWAGPDWVFEDTLRALYYAIGQ